MTLILRKQTAEDRVEGRQPLDWGEDDYAMVDETPIGRIFKQQMAAGPKWVWFLQVAPVPPPNEGVADTLEHFSIRLGVARVREISFAFVCGNLFEKRGDCSPKFLNSSRLHFA